ncbi:ATP synthase subunit I [Mycolicibacter sinensis]
MTTPAQDAPLVLPSVVFQPIRLLLICIALTAVATLAAAGLGHVMFGAFFGFGMALGLVNALLIRRSVQSITAQDHPLKSKMAMNSATRLLVITVVGLVVAYLFRPQGLGVLFGLALFEVLLVATTALPVMKKLRSEAATGSDALGTEGTAQ